MPGGPVRKLTIIAQDPDVVVGDRILRAVVDVPNEALEPGPRGYRVQVIDYDSASDTLYQPVSIGADADPYQDAPDRKLVEDPRFHQQNAYAIVMRTLARFERALGRRVSWSFESHQITVAPHAFSDANAFYSPSDQAILFGYFPKSSGKGTVYSCLSHDVVAHETTHALLDGLRERYMLPSSEDQAAFHEGYADIVALLSILSLKEIVRVAIDYHKAGGDQNLISKQYLTAETLGESLLFGLAEQMGVEMDAVRGDALRRSVKLKPGKDYRADENYQEAHQRGEIPVAAVMNAYLNVWLMRIQELGELKAGMVSRERVSEEGAETADRLLDMMVRALDYCPPTDILFEDFVSAVLTADVEINPDDSKYGFRKALRESFAGYGIQPASKGDKGREPGTWGLPTGEPSFSRSHFESMQRDPNEVFRFVWENRELLGLSDLAYTKVQSVRPCLRVSPDGFWLRETVAEYIQMLTVTVTELAGLGIKVPKPLKDMLGDKPIQIYGGSALIFDEYGKLKYVIGTNVLNKRRQSERLEALWRNGHSFEETGRDRARLARLHRKRMTRWSPVANYVGEEVGR